MAAEHEQAPAETHAPAGSPGGGVRSAPGMTGVFAAGNAAVARAILARATLARDGGAGASQGAGAPAAAPPAPAGPGIPPPAPGTGGAGLNYEDVRFTTDTGQVREIIEKSIVQRGWQQTCNWLERFITPADPVTATPLGSTEDDAARVRKVVRDELTVKENQLKLLVGDAVLDTGDVRVGGGTFEPAALANTNLLLATSEKQLKAESERYGLKSSGWVFKDYSTTAGGPVQMAMQEAAKALSMKRWQTDRLRSEFLQSQGRVNDPKLTVPGITIADPTEEARKRWIADEEVYRQLAAEKQALYPVLAAYTTADDAATKLGELATQNTDQFAESLYKTIDKRLANIATVREQIGVRYTIWKQPQIIALTKKTQGLSAWESRLVDAKVNKVKSDEKEDAEFWAAIALGVGMLGAIPTGGAAMAGSVALATMVTAAGSLSAVYSMQTLYEHYKDHELQSAASETALDKAQSIAKDAPDLSWLAQDLLDLGLNLAGAAAAFKALHEAIELAKASQLAKLPELALACKSAGLGAEVEGRVVAHAIGQAGGARTVKATLVEIGLAVRQTHPSADLELAAGIRAAADKAIIDGKVISLSPQEWNRPGALFDILKKRNPSWSNADLKWWAERVHGALRGDTNRGLYEPAIDFIFLKGDASPDSVATVLSHELVHRHQNFEGTLKAMGRFQAEYEAFVVQQQFLRTLPASQVPQDMLWLYDMSLSQIRNHILTAYPGTAVPKGFQPGEVAEAILQEMRNMKP